MNSESFYAFTAQRHFVAYRPAASVTEFISDRNDWLELERDHTPKTSVKYLLRWRKLNQKQWNDHFITTRGLFPGYINTSCSISNITPPERWRLFHFNLVYLLTLTSEAEKVLYHQWPHEADFLLVKPDRTAYEKYRLYRRNSKSTVPFSCLWQLCRRWNFFLFYCLNDIQCINRAWLHLVTSCESSVPCGHFLHSFIILSK